MTTHNISTEWLRELSAKLPELDEDSRDVWKDIWRKTNAGINTYRLDAGDLEVLRMFADEVGMDFPEPPADDGTPD